MKIGLMVAMQSEFDLISQILDNSQQKKIAHLNFIEGRLADKDIVLMQSGIGKVNASIATVEMIKNFMPNSIINTGIAGGISSDLSVMDIVLGQEIVYHDVWCGEGNQYGQVQGLPAVFVGDNNLLQKTSTIKSDVKIHRGKIVSGDKFISDLNELQEIKRCFQDALAVDMESAAIAQVCYLYKVPFLAIRIISDTPGIEKHNEQYQNFWKQAPEKTLEIMSKLLS